MKVKRSVESQKFVQKARKLVRGKTIKHINGLGLRKIIYEFWVQPTCGIEINPVFSSFLSETYASPEKISIPIMTTSISRPSSL